MMPLAMANVGDAPPIPQSPGRAAGRQRRAAPGVGGGETGAGGRELGGNLILNVKESRVALDKTMAMRIMV